jgi:hypothetical protein
LDDEGNICLYRDWLAFRMLHDDDLQQSPARVGEFFYKSVAPPGQQSVERTLALAYARLFDRNVCILCFRHSVQPDAIPTKIGPFQ